MPAETSPPDLRLAGLAVAAWLTALAGLHLGPGPLLAVTVAAAGVTTVGALHLLGGLGHPRAAVRRYGWIAVAVGRGGVCAGAA
ncbi:competence protein ComEC, partial [Micromonospora zamorensis]